MFDVNGSTRSADFGFAKRSAHYLADRGCSPKQIRQTLIEELDLAVLQAERIVGDLAA